MASEITRIILASALVLALFGAGLRIYRRLPADYSPANVEAGDPAGTELTIVLRLKSPAEHPASQLALYHLDMQALQREFSASPYSGRRFEEFLAQRIRGMSPVRAQFDIDGRATVKVTPGNWWLHAKLALADEESAEWRLPVVIAENKQTIELTTENAYERTKKF